MQSRYSLPNVLFTMQTVEKTAPSPLFSTEILKSRCLLSRPVTSSLSVRAKIGHAPILSADAVSRPDLGMHDLRNGRRLDAEQAGDAISGDHHPLHPTRPMTEHRDEDIG